MRFSKGQRVIHPGRPDWGLGQVLEDSASSSVRVFFVGAGERQLSLDHVSLVQVQGDEAAHPVLDNLRAIPSDGGVRYLSLPRAIERFLELYPEGFYGDKYLSQERNYKVRAHELALSLIGEDALSALCQAGKFGEVSRLAQRIVNATNLIFPNEKMSLKDGLIDPKPQEAFSNALRKLLYSSEPFEDRFTDFARVLGEIGAAKWTTATYFPFLVHPEEHMFVKPTVTQKAAELSAFEINYRPELNWITYKCVLDYSTYLRNALTALKPRDMIDVQSFMWCIAPEI